MSHRHHHPANESAVTATPSSSIPGTPLVGCQDYTIVPNTDEVVSSECSWFYLDLVMIVWNTCLGFLNPQLCYRVL
jgi:hypothetical protein